MASKILIAGVGGIGGPLAADLIVNGVDVDLLTSNPEITKNINEKGLTVEWKGRQKQIPAKAYTSPRDLPAHQYDIVFLIMKAYNVRDAILSTMDRLSSSGYYVTCQNGVVEDMLGDVIETNRIVPCTIGWGGSMLGPGMYKRTSDGVNIIGELNGEITPRINELKTLMSYNSKTRITDNIVGVKWSKLAINSSINSVGVITGEVLGVTLSVKRAREIFLRVYSEVIDLANAQGIRPEKVVTNPYLLYIPKDSSRFKRFIKDRLVMIVGRKYGDIKSSSLQSLERGRKTEIEFLNGYVSRKAADIGFEVPANKAIYKMVREIEDGTRKLGMENIDELYMQLQNSL